MEKDEVGETLYREEEHGEVSEEVEGYEVVYAGEKVDD